MDDTLDGTGRRVAVVGGGAVGLTAAHDLAARGTTVTLYERDAVGSASTGRAAGILHDAYAEDVDARIGTRAIERFREFSGRGEFAFEPSPYVWFVTESGPKADVIREQVAGMQRHDRDVERLSGEKLAAEFPAMRADDVVEAAVAWDAGVADTSAYADLLAAEAVDAGVELREETPASVATDPPRVNGTEYDAVVVAAGAHTKRVLADAGLSVPLKPYRVQALTANGVGSVPTTNGTDGTATTNGTDGAATDDAGGMPTFYDATAGYYARPHPEGLLAGDGTEPVEADPEEYDRTGDDWFVEATTEGLEDRLRDYAADVNRAWAGLCVATPDRDPLLGELADGVYVAAGWQGHGFMRAPATGEAIATQVLGGEGVPEFDPTRFDGDEEFDIVEGMTVE